MKISKSQQNSYSLAFSSNKSGLTESIESNYVFSAHFLDLCCLINLYLTIFFIIIGLIGHFLTIFVFGQKRFRKNSSNVYLLFLALNDSVFLILHFFEDSIKSYIAIYSTGEQEGFFISLINIIDQFDVACKLINYLRYVTRFISAYTIIAFTLQRLALVYSPLSNKFKTKKSAWQSVLIISIFSMILNIWVPFLFQLKQTNALKYCDVSSNWSIEYFHITLVYICLIMALPILFILMSNFMIIKKLNRAKHKRKDMTRLKRAIDPVNPLSSNKANCSRVQKPFYLNVEQIISRISKKSDYSKKLTRMLMFISFSYVLFNLPYLISWFVYYYNIILSTFDENNLEQVAWQNLYFSLVKISEIFYLLNYSVTFYIYCASGSIFREQLKYSGIFDFILIKCV